MDPRWRRRRLVRAGLVAGCLVAAAGAGAGLGKAAVAVGPPQSTAAPTISGLALVGQTLTAASGSWSGTTPIAFAYQWQRCDPAGASCVAVSGATAQTYLLTASDVGQTIRVQVSATNAVGSASVLSSATGLVAASPLAGAIRLPDGMLSIPIAAVLLPDRLLFASVRFLPAQPVAGQPFVLRVRVADTAGYVIRGALVSALALPYGLIAATPETASGSDGWASIRMLPARLLPLGPNLTAAVFVRARKPGDPALAGVSTSSLVQLPLARPAARSAPSSPYPPGSSGYDLSYPDCARPRPPQAAFAILGVNGGRPFTFNPCLAREYGWYATTGAEAVYLNTGYQPRLHSQITPACAFAANGLSGRRAQAYAIGCSEAATSLERVTLLGLAPPLVWWLDVETSNSWSPDRQLNTDTLRGLIDYLGKLTPAPVVGIYSRPSWWREITAGWSLAAPEWIPRASGASCPAPFSHGPVWLAQAGSATLDVDSAC